jgi:hypothetical protein
MRSALFIPPLLTFKDPVLPQSRWQGLYHELLSGEREQPSRHGATRGVKFGFALCFCVRQQLLMMAFRAALHLIGVSVRRSPTTIAVPRLVDRLRELLTFPAVPRFPGFELAGVGPALSPERDCDEADSLADGDSTPGGLLSGIWFAVPKRKVRALLSLCICRHNPQRGRVGVFPNIRFVVIAIPSVTNSLICRSPTAANDTAR